MSIGEDIRKLLRRHPFKPFTIHSTDGKALSVKHPDYCFVAPNNAVVYVYPTEDTREIMPIGSVARVEHVAEQIADSAD